MKTVMMTRIKAHIDKLQFGYWDEDAFVPLHGLSQDEMCVAAEKLGVSIILLDALVMFTESLRAELGKDMADIWKLVDI